MAGLQRSAVSFRRQGSSGLVWDDKLIQAELMNQAAASQREEDDSTGAGEATKSKAQDEIVQSGGGGQDVKEEISKASPRPAGGSMERSRSTGGGRGYRTGRVSLAIEPPSPKVSACGFCSAFGKQQDKSRRRPPKHAGKRTI